MTSRFFFDTYALIEVGKGNPAYTEYSTDVDILLNNLNLMEFAYFLLREQKSDEIPAIFEKLSRFHVDYDTELLSQAAAMKFTYAKEKLSFVDCIGYFLAKKHRVKFLTGDEKFRYKENVEFVKK